jgi:osmoprotectant transport system ATP-binding protein
MIVFDQVTKRYPGSTEDVVDNLSLTIHDGEICILVGPSGCGKTTTMKMINKLIPLSSGSIRIDDQNIESMDTIRLRLNIGYIIQDVGLFPHMTVGENIATVPVELGWKKPQIAERVDELLELVDLDPNLYRNKKPRELSGGQRQRVGVARALAADPKIMLMDEPFGALDPISRAKLQDEFLRIQQKIRKTIVFVTHDIDEALKMGDRIVVMRSGQVVQYGRPMEILAKPADPFVSELIGGRNALKMMNLILCEQIMQREDAAAMYASAMDAARTGLPAGQGALVSRVMATVPIQATAQDALAEMFRTNSTTVFVMDDSLSVQGTIRMQTLLEKVGEYGG